MDLQKVKKILKKIFILPPVPTLLIAIPSYALVIYVLSNGLEIFCWLSCALPCCIM